MRLPPLGHAPSRQLCPAEPLAPDVAEFVQYAEDEDGSLVAVARQSMTARSPPLHSRDYFFLALVALYASNIRIKIYQMHII